MNRRVLPLIIGSLLLALGCGGPTGLEPSEFCSASDVAITTFEDANLEAAIRAALSVGAQEPLTCGLISGLTVLDASSAGITSLVGIQNLTSLRDLGLSFNSITDISALSGLTSLTSLSLFDNSITDLGALRELTSLRDLNLILNSITDISALSGLTSLTDLGLSSNSVSDIQPLLDNTGLGAGDTVDLRVTSVSCPDVAALQDKGVSVLSDCP